MRKVKENILSYLRMFSSESQTDVAESQSHHDQPTAIVPPD